MRPCYLSRLLVLLILFLQALPLHAELLKLTILHINDPHAHYLPYTEKGVTGDIGGFAKMETVIKGIQAENRAQGRETMLLMGGDLLTGTPFSIVFKGKMGAELLNAMGFDAMVVGNHEFDYRLENLLELKGLLKFPLLSANIRNHEGVEMFEPFVEKRFAGLTTKVLVFGLTTPETPFRTHPNNVQGLIFDETGPVTAKILQGASNKDLVIALTHLGVTEDEKLAREFPRINVIIGGHSHTALVSPEAIGKTVIAQAGCNAKYLGRVDVDFDDGKIINYSGNLILLDDKVKEDPAIDEVIRPYKEKLAGTMNEAIGNSEEDFEGGRDKPASCPGADLGKIVALLMAKAGKAEAAFVNVGSIRSGIQKGVVTLGTIYTVLPFPGTVVTEDLQGADIEAALQRNVDLTPANGGRLQTFGVAYKVVDGRVKVSRIGDREFDPAKTYSIAMNDFLAAGGDGYTVFKEKGTKNYDTGEVPADLLADFVRENKNLTRRLVESLLEKENQAAKE
jgi:5'-nucleotidase/UDP-sugar diphosphatase